MRNKLLTAFLLGLMTALLFGYTRSWTESTPTDSTVANQIDDYNRYLRVDAAERLEDYIGGFNASDSNEGFYHVLYIEKSDTPSTPAAGKGMTYGKAVGGKCELFWIDEDGDEKQITSDGVLKIAGGDFDANSIDQDDIELDNDSYLVAVNAAGTADVNLIKADANDVAVIPDNSQTATNTAPTSSTGIANKKYVDDSVGAGTGYWDTDSTVLFNDSGLTAADTFQDLDVATLASLDAVNMLCFFQITYNYITGAEAGKFAMKPKGEGSATFAHHTSIAGGTSHFEGDTDGDIVYFVCATDSSGIVQIGSNGAAANYKWTVKLLGYIK